MDAPAILCTFYLNLAMRFELSWNYLTLAASSRKKYPYRSGFDSRSATLPYMLNYRKFSMWPAVTTMGPVELIK